MTVKLKTKDPDIRGSLPALKRAAKNAYRLAIDTGTPFYVMKNGRMVNLNHKPKRRKKSA